jgi:hypothetical protein
MNRSMSTSDSRAFLSGGRGARLRLAGAPAGEGPA